MGDGESLEVKLQAFLRSFINHGNGDGHVARRRGTCGISSDPLRFLGENGLWSPRANGYKARDSRLPDAPPPLGKSSPMPTATPPVAIIMGSRSDWPTMKKAADALDALGVAFETKVVSAHRTPQRLVEFSTGAQAAGYKVIIAGAGGAAHLPGMVASMTILPVLGVPVQSKALNGLDSLLSIVQMPGGVPVATLAIGEAGAKNAGLLAAQILALSDEGLAQRLQAFRDEQTDSVVESVED
jgi:5-(carboxyamino)imidazole ribonucleotide mutase